MTKKTKSRKKKVSKFTVSKWSKKMEHLQREIYFKKFGKKCVFPNCKEPAYCLDHYYTRDCKRLFFYFFNLSPICRGHHYLKTHNSHYVCSELSQIVMKKAGSEWEKVTSHWTNRSNYNNWNSILFREVIEKHLLNGELVPTEFLDETANSF